MVKLTQNVEAAFQAERTGGTGDSYGDPTPDAALKHFGLLDTFDPRSVEMNITPVASIGQSTEGFHADGPVAVSLPIKVAAQGTEGWLELIGRSIGASSINSTMVPNNLTNTVDSMAVLAKDNVAGDFTLAVGVVPNEITLEADYTTGGYITVDAACTAFMTQDGSDANFSDDGKFLNDNFASSTFPSCPTANPLLPTDLTVSLGLAASSNYVTVDGPAGSYVAVGERYMRFYDSADALSSGVPSGDDDSIVANGVVDLTHANADDTQNLDDIADAGWTGWTITKSGSTVSSVNLLKGIYNTESAKAIYATDNMTSTLSNLKTVKLMIKNNNVPVPGKTTRNGVTKWITNNSISRGLADVTLEVTMTAEDETYYQKYLDGTTIPLVRLDFGASYGSIALTNGTITSYTRPLSGAGEVVDTMTIKFRGAGDYKNFSSYAISADWTLSTT